MANYTSKQCPECGQYGGTHRYNCPNRPAPQEMYKCVNCGATIFEGDEYYRLASDPWCVICVDNGYRSADPYDE